MVALAGSCNRTLTVTMCAWPSARLPLRALMQTPQQGSCPAMLSGLDVFLAQKDPPQVRLSHIVQ